MDQAPRICPKCGQANFPIAEFCRHCGEPMFEMGTLARSTFLQRTVGQLVDGLFWIIDELIRWWEIGKITFRLKALRKNRARLMKTINESGSEESRTTPEKEALLKISEDISRLSNREDFLRKRSWQMTPEVLLAAILIVFVCGIMFVKPRNQGLKIAPTTIVSVAGDIKNVVEIPIFGMNSVITSAGWLEDRFFVGGDGGVLEINLRTRQVARVAPLPPTFFCRSIVPENEGKILLSGYDGVFSLDSTGLKPIYDKESFSGALINCLAQVKGGHLIGTLGSGIFSARLGKISNILSTNGLGILGFTWFEGECWVLHEKGILKGSGSEFSQVSLPSIEGRRLFSISASDKAIYIGTDNGLIAGYREEKNWIWSNISAEGVVPRKINDILVVNGVVLVLAEEGLFRLSGTSLKKISNPAGGKIMSIGKQCLGIAGKDKAVFYFFGVSEALAEAISPLPVIGSFTIPATPTNPLIQKQQTADIPSDRKTPDQILSQSVTQSAVSPLNPTVTQSDAQLQQKNISSFNLPNNSSTNSPVNSSINTPVNSLTSSQPSSTGLPSVLFNTFISSLGWGAGSLWVGTANDGLWRLNGDNWINYSRKNNTLGDDQIVSIFVVKGRPYFYSWLMGLCTFENENIKTILSPKDSTDLLSLTGDSTSLFFLFEGGIIKRLKDSGEFEEFERVSPDFSKNSRFLHIFEGKAFVVTDQGIVMKNPQGNWVVATFENQVPKQKAVFSLSNGTSQIYTALNDGRIYIFEKNKIAFGGKMDNSPKYSCFSKSPIFGDGNKLYTIENRALKTLSIGSPISFSSFAHIPEKKKVFFANSQGLKDVQVDF
ncbi:MAG: zinc ribbon domain-containing protein [Candidatus Riflebacteria bacterium]|nr:zinc ribbon domain-containing protein [Candidatus Riflebacteria bacterium]